MIVKLKCIDNIDVFGMVSGYITVGKIYDAEECSHGAYEIIDDYGDVMTALLNGCNNGKWEIVN